MRKMFGLVLAFLFVAVPLMGLSRSAQAALPKVDLVMWHQEGEDTMKSLAVQKLFDDWAKTNAPGPTLSLGNKETQSRRTQSQTAPLPGDRAPHPPCAPHRLHT